MPDEKPPEVKPAWAIPRADPVAYRSKKQAETERKAIDAMGRMLDGAYATAQARSAAKAVVVMLTRMLPHLEPKISFSVDASCGAVNLSWQVRGEVKPNGYVVAFDSMTIDQYGTLGPIYRHTQEVTHGDNGGPQSSRPVVDPERPPGDDLDRSEKPSG